MHAPAHIVWFRHDLLILGLSLAVSLGASATALRLMIYAGRLRRGGELLLLLGGACGGAGGWATSFMTLLSFEPGYAVGFDAARVGASLALPVFAGALGILVSLKVGRPWNVPLWGLIFATGVGLMDYLSLTALQVDGRLVPSVPAMLAALLLGPALAMLAMRLAVKARRWLRFSAASACMGLALFSMQALMEVDLRRLPQAHHHDIVSLTSRAALAGGVAGLTALLAAVALLCIWLQARASRRSHERLHSIFEALPLPVAYYDREERFIMGNASYLRQLTACGLSIQPGWRHCDMMQTTIAREKPDWTQEQHEAWVAARSLPRGRSSHQYEQELRGGSYILSQFNRTREGGVIVALTDISEYRRQTIELASARDQAEAATRAKSDFLANMSHEIRTPLNGVLGMAQAMAAEPLSPAQRERLDVVRQSGEALLCILNDVLDISKVEAGKLELEAHAFDLQALVEGAHGALSAVAAQKALKLSWSVQEAAAGCYLGDAARLRQILLNLLSNALKFTGEGSVRLDVSAGNDGLVFAVADTGMGMEPDQLARLFQKFSQADASTTRRFGGTGLGLAICKDLSRLMGGSIEVESALGTGSTFRVRLPLQKVADIGPAVCPEPAGEAPGVGLRVLAAEDNPVNQLVLKTLLNQIGAEPVIVGDGLAAVEAWAREDWDVILMDVQMPCMDGPSAAREIRAREKREQRRRTPIVALTANAMAHQVAAYAEAGMDAFVAKPIVISELFSALELAIGGPQALAA